MPIDFAAILVIAAALTGCVWLLDVAVLGPRRAKQGSLARPGGGSVRVSPNQADKLPWYVDFSRSFFPVIIAVLILRSFLVEPFRIPSGSMEPTLQDGDFILVNKFAYGLRLPVINTKLLELGSPEHGDVVVFRYPKDPATAYIKRIVGLPGDELSYKNKRVFINDEAVPVKLLPNGGPGSKPGYDLLEEILGDNDHHILVKRGFGNPPPNNRVTVPAGHYFVMGDNRDNSHDSRYWGFVPEENLIGNAFFIWMNLDCITANGNCNRIGSSIK